jgi:tetratricopeptide (TPR) repeat protein
MVKSATSFSPSLRHAVLLGATALVLLAPIPGVAQSGTTQVGAAILPVDFEVTTDRAIAGEATNRANLLYEQAVTADQNASLFLDRGIDNDRRGQYDRALQDYGRVIELDPRNDKAFGNRCFDEAILGQLDLAVVDCSVSLRLRPNNAGVFDSRGLANLKLNRLEAAIADYDAALKIEPELAVSLFGRGVAKRRQGDVAGGNADIAAARKIRADIADDMAKMGVRL